METRIDYKETPQGMMDGLMRTGGFIRKSAIPHTLQELLHFRVSQLNGCAFCLDMHAKDALHQGEDPQRLFGLAAWKEAPYYTPAERAALALADGLTQKCEVTDEVYQELTRHFSKEEIAVLALLISNVGTWNRLNITFRTPAGWYQPGQPMGL
ncbi:carboxymuconolactone decarboxylase family protein [Chitinophaga solisilvae]|uniref:Carboxymuconolactone decarboxylase family protein n=1 Tax=Chitinophaga solisilvae TaxID=1233460 RepID=A0A3S1D349_9BACT|nr:carboxymuconolactone decarboxylase family protein [Chitinophaga solisilvae]NSL90896.1 carboxymuconolactone decarboxylase family protein [Chitinophaga solisilvae]